VTRYIVIGAGAVGAVLAARLTGTDQEAVLVGRGENIRRIAADGLRLFLHGEPSTVQLGTASSQDEVHLRPDDVLVFATKVQDLEAAARDWAWRPAGSGVAADLPVLSLQNGLDADRILLRRFARVLGGTILTSSQHISPGEVRSAALGPIGVLTVGAVPGGADPALAGLATDLRRAGYIVQLSDDVTRWKAAKLLFSVRNGLEVLSGGDAARHDLGDRLVAEAREALAAAGLTVADTVAERTEDVSAFRADPASGVQPGQQSTWQSFARGASPETDFLNGEVVLLGRLHGVPTPVNAALQRVLGEAASRGDRPGTRSLDEVENLLPTEVPA
jgi:2-dehydropantoate 2-reductase